MRDQIVTLIFYRKFHYVNKKCKLMKACLQKADIQPGNPIIVAFKL